MPPILLFSYVSTGPSNYKYESIVTFISRWLFELSLLMGIIVLMFPQMQGLMGLLGQLGGSDQRHIYP